MSKDLWTAVDDYFADLLITPDPGLEAALHASAEAGLPPIQVSPHQGKLLWLVARMLRARTILEIGTLAGYSTIWLGRALPADGRLITLEIDAQHAALARGNIANAGLGDCVEVRVGPALETLEQLAGEACGPFDLTFIDADKQNNVGYFSWALKLSRPGSVIVVDNVVRNGAVIDAASSDPIVQGVRHLAEVVGAEARVSATAIQTVGSKGYDGFAFVLVGG